MATDLNHSLGTMWFGHENLMETSMEAKVIIIPQMSVGYTHTCWHHPMEKLPTSLALNEQDQSVNN